MKQIVFDEEGACEKISFAALQNELSHTFKKIVVMVRSDKHRMFLIKWDRNERNWFIADVYCGTDLTIRYNKLRQISESFPAYTLYMFDTQMELYAEAVKEEWQ